MESILNIWEKPAVPPTGELKVNWGVLVIDWLASMMATTLPKTAGAMQPIHEYNSVEYLTENVDPLQQEPVRNYTFKVPPKERSPIWIISDGISYNNCWQVRSYD